MRRPFPIRWPESNGWLALSGSPGPRSDIRAQALSRANANGVIACISLADDLGDDLMDDLADLGAPTGYLVDLQEGWALPRPFKNADHAGFAYPCLHLQPQMIEFIGDDGRRSPFFKG